MFHSTVRALPLILGTRNLESRHYLRYYQEIMLRTPQSTSPVVLAAFTHQNSYHTASRLGKRRRLLVHIS
jgi:hypothetical protein